MSLSLLTMLSIKEYATLLILANLVTISAKKQQTGYIIGTSAMNTWQPVLVQHNLHNHGQNLAKATMSVIYTGGLMKTPSNAKRSIFHKDMHLLGIGYYEQGVTTNASLQIKGKSELPEYYQLRKLRTAQRWFFWETKPLLQDAPTTEGFMAQRDAVMEWVELKQLAEDFEPHSPPTELQQVTMPPPPQNQPPQSSQASQKQQGRPKKSKGKNQGRPRKKRTELSDESIDQDEEIVEPKDMGEEPKGMEQPKELQQPKETEEPVFDELEEMDQPKELQQPKETEQPVFDGNDE